MDLDNEIYNNRLQKGHLPNTLLNYVTTSYAFIARGCQKDFANASILQYSHLHACVHAYIHTHKRLPTSSNICTYKYIHAYMHI